MRFEEFAAARLPALMRFAVVLTGDRGLAEDVVQEVLIRVHARWRRIVALDSPEPYIRRMVVNEYLTWRRRWWRLVPQADPTGTAGTTRSAGPRTAATAAGPVTGGPVTGAPTAPDPATEHAERDALLGELRKLPPRQRAVLVLRYYEGLSDAEIADALGCAPGTVRGYASRALAALRIELVRVPAFLQEGN